MGIQILSNFFRPNPVADYYLVSDVDLQGGYRIVADNTARDAIVTSQRKIGMLVYSIGSATTYQLIGGLLNVNWVAQASSAYDTIQNNGSSLTQRTTLNVLPRLVAADTGSLTTLDLNTSGVSAGTYNTVTVDVYGRVTVGANASYVLTTRNLTAGTGLTGGGDLSADRTFAIDTAIVATLTGVQTLTNKTLTAPTINGTVATSGLTMPTFSLAGALITSSGSPVAAGDLVNKSYVDGLVSGLKVKPAVRALAASNQTLSGLPVLDTTVTTVDGDRVLNINQTSAIENGIWVVHAGAWTRPTDFATGSSAASAFTFVEEGTLYHDTGWTCTTDAPNDIVDTNNLTFVQFSSAGVILAGTGLTKTGNTLSITNTGVTAAAYGAADSVATLTVNAQGQLTTAATISILITEAQVTNLVTDLANKVPVTRNVNTAVGRLTGGGALSADLTLDLASGIVTPGTYNSLTVDTYGRVTAGSTVSTGHIIQAATVDQPQRGHLNFAATFAVTDNSGADRTSVDVATGGISDAQLANIYARLAGRSGGQTLNGSTLTAENLVLKANAVDANLITISGTTTTFGSAVTDLLVFNSAVSGSITFLPGTGNIFLQRNDATVASQAAGNFTLLGQKGGDSNGGAVGGDGGRSAQQAGAGGLGSITSNRAGGVGGTARVISGAGGNTPGGTGAGGAAGAVFLTGANGGVNSAGTGNGGSGAALTMTGGAGGAAGATSGNAGNGQASVLTGATGGAANATGTGTAGVGGALTIGPGVGGAGAAAIAGGVGGALIARGATGGAGGSGFAAGAGGALTLNGGDAGASNTGAGGAGAGVTLRGGNATGTGNNNGGNIAINGGTATGSGTIGTITITGSVFTSTISGGITMNSTGASAGYNIQNAGNSIFFADAAGNTYLDSINSGTKTYIGNSNTTRGVVIGGSANGTTIDIGANGGTGNVQTLSLGAGTTINIHHNSAGSDMTFNSAGSVFLDSGNVGQSVQIGSASGTRRVTLGGGTNLTQIDMQIGGNTIFDASATQVLIGSNNNQLARIRAFSTSVLIADGINPTFIRGFQGDFKVGGGVGGFGLDVQVLPGNGANGSTVTAGGAAGAGVYGAGAGGNGGTSGAGGVGGASSLIGGTGGTAGSTSGIGGNGGTAVVNGGTGGAANGGVAGSGGITRVNGGDGGAAAGAIAGGSSGGVSIYGGTGGAANAGGGAAGSGSQTHLEGGYGGAGAGSIAGGAAGSVLINGGLGGAGTATAAAGAGGSLTINGGDAGASNAGVGAIGALLSLRGGNATGTGNNNGGSITIDTGTSTGTGTASLLLGSSNASSITVGQSGNTVAIAAKLNNSLTFLGNANYNISIAAGAAPRQLQVGGGADNPTFITTGNGSSGNDGAILFIYGGSGSATGNKNGGDCIIGGGDGGGTGLNGRVIIGGGSGTQRAREVQIGTGVETTIVKIGNTTTSLTTINGPIALPTGIASSITGTATMVAGTVTVSTTSVHSGSQIQLTHGGTGLLNLGVLYVGTIVDGTSFDIKSANILDNDTVHWLVVN